MVAKVPPNNQETELAALIARGLVADAAVKAKGVLETATEVDKKWHVGKEVPLVMVAAFIAQTFGVGWFMSQLTSKVDNLITTVAVYSAERYTKDDARRDQTLMEQKLTFAATTLGEKALVLEQRLAAAVAERNDKLAAIATHDADLSRRVESLEGRRK